MTADHDQGVVQILFGAQKPHPNPFAFVDPFGFLRDAHQSVSPDQGGDHAGAALQRHGHKAIVNPTHDDPEEFLEAQFGGHLAAHDGIHRRPTGFGKPLKPRKQRSDELFEGHDGGYGIAGKTNERLAFHESQEHGFSGHHGHAVDEEPPQILDEGGRIVFRTGGRARVENDDVRIGKRRFFHAGPKRLGVVSHPGMEPGDPAFLLDHGGDDGAVEFHDLPGAA